MATEREAGRARAKHAEHLRSLGAHSVSVDQVRRAGKTTFAVVAMFSAKPRGLPKTLDVTVGRKVVTVPLVAAKAQRFRLE